MTQEEKSLIDETIMKGGEYPVRTIPLVDGRIMSNYTKFREYFRNHVWTKEMSNYVNKNWDRILSK